MAPAMPRRHFLIVAAGVQGHVNPARLLGRRLTDVDNDALVTLSISLSGHRLMFPSLAAPDEEASDGVLSYAPFSDGLDDGSWSTNAEQVARSREASVRTLSGVVSRLASRGRPVTCIVSTLTLPWTGEVARKHGVPLALYWIQPATALATYYHYFHGYAELVASHAAEPAFEVSMPGLAPLTIREFPSFLVDTTKTELSALLVEVFRDVFRILDQNPTVLVNSAVALEATALKALQPTLEVFAVGPMVPSLDIGEDTREARIHLFKQDEKAYMEWLSALPAKSVVYISFGSLLACGKRQAAEIAQGLRQCGRPYLWVLRKDAELCLVDSHNEHDEGMVVEWCEQLEVLSHPAAGCFVTHCGWNSTLEAVAAGVPMVAVPQWSDQATNAHLVEEWGVGARAERDGEGVLVGEELARCVELVMGDSEKGAEMREKAAALRERAREAVSAGGPADRCLRDFVEATHPTL